MRFGGGAACATGGLKTCINTRKVGVRGASALLSCRMSFIHTLMIVVVSGATAITAYLCSCMFCGRAAHLSFRPCASMVASVSVQDDLAMLFVDHRTKSTIRNLDRKVPVLPVWVISRVYSPCRAPMRRHMLIITCPVWFAVLSLLGSWAALVFTSSWRLRLRRRKRGLCTACGYNLTGNISGICPECGVAVMPVRRL